MRIRLAKPYDSKILTELAINSEAYWGYDSDFMERFKVEYKVTEEFIINNPTFIIQEEEEIVGFYGILIERSNISLEYLYVEPRSIGKGYGKLLWDHMVGNCKSLGIKELEIVTSPQAKEFYIKMGAKPSGEVESLVMPGRRIPRLNYTL